MDRPDRGGRWTRDPETRAVKPAAEAASAPAVEADPALEADPETTSAPAAPVRPTRKGK